MTYRVTAIDAGSGCYHTRVVDPTHWIFWLVGAYLVGAIPFGLLLGKMRGVDIRVHGSGNVGATNAGRVLGRRWGIACFALDVAKGLGPVLGYGVWSGIAPYGEPDVLHTLAWFGIAAAAVMGHVFPVYLRFRGGKGVATGFGVLLGMFPVLTAAAAVTAVLWLAVMKLAGYVSLASIIAATALPVLAAAFAAGFGRTWPQVGVYAGITAVLAALVVVRHRANIGRLWAGTEPKAKWAG